MEYFVLETYVSAFMIYYLEPLKLSELADSNCYLQLSFSSPQQDR